jgi:hypothetical protein
MKYYKNCEILKVKGIRANQWLSKRRSFNKLYNDYKIRNLKQENIKINHINSQSNLYPFTPLINRSGYITFSPKNGGIYSPNTSRYNSFQKSRISSQNCPIVSEYSSLGRNILTDGNLYNDKNPIKINDYNYLDNNNSNLYGYQNDYFNNNKYKKDNLPNRNNLNRTDYRFHTPNHKNRNGIKNKSIYSNTDDQINSQIFQYLNNFRKNNRNLNNNSKKINNNYMKTTPRRRIKSNIKLNLGNKFNIDGHKISPLINNTESPYNSKIDNYFNKNGKKIKNSRINERLNEYNKLKNKYDIKYSNLKDKKEKNNNKSKQNSNASLNPSSVGMKTFYTNKPITTNNNIGTGVGSNINSASSRKLDHQNHFINGLRMTSGEVNEYFYDFNKKDSNDKNDDQKTTQSLQSLSDSKMLELANYYINEEDDSTENYQMNNVVYNKKKHNIK